MRKGFSLVELLVAVAVIGMLASVVAVAVLPARRKARDAARIAEMNQMGRFLLAISCYAPSTGPGDYDLQALYRDLVTANPNVATYIKEAPRDPRSGTATASGYRYVYDAGQKCALYANLESPEAQVTLEGLTAPTPGGGTGTLRAGADGPNGSPFYYQVAR